MLFYNRCLPVEKMIELEDKLKQSPLAKIGFAKTDEELANILGLEIVVVHDDELPRDTEATLTHNDNPTYFGLIQVKQTYRRSMFACIHEIIQYVFDVGCSNYVQGSFERKVRGKTQDAHEQEINYMTASYSMPFTQIKEAIQCYNNSFPKADELVFVHNLCERYGQERESVLRRIREVKRIDRDRRTKKSNSIYSLCEAGPHALGVRLFLPHKRYIFSSLT